MRAAVPSETTVGGRSVDEWVVWLGFAAVWLTVLAQLLRGAHDEASGWCFLVGGCLALAMGIRALYWALHKGARRD